MRVTYARHLSASLIRVNFVSAAYPCHFIRVKRLRHLSALVYPRHLSLICIIFPRQSSATAATSSIRANYPRRLSVSVCVRLFASNLLFAPVLRASCPRHSSVSIYPRQLSASFICINLSASFIRVIYPYQFIRVIHPRHLSVSTYPRHSSASFIRVNLSA